MYRKSYNRNAPRSGSPRGGHSDRGRSFGPSRGQGGRSSGRRESRGNAHGQYIDPSKFINKAVITEEIEHFTPEHAFADFAFDEALKRAISAKGYVTPTPIQDRTIPHILKGQDVVGIANTGTGKTAAFLLPLIHKVLSNRKEQIIIIVPTRELACQIDVELKDFTKGMKIYSVCCYGGSSVYKQMRDLRFFNNFIIERKTIRLGEFRTIVLDEADRMLDMGFVNDMRYVVSLMPKDRQTLFFSATLSSDIEKLIGDFLHEPVRISVKTGDTAKNVDQDIVRIHSGKNKLDVLHDLLTQPEFNKVLIFGRTKHGVEKLSRVLNDRGFKVESIHGNKNQSHRQKALDLFKGNRVQALIATDVAARGLDIVDVSHVINFDIPATYEDYVHRIGRTGRANKKGKALTFIE